MSREQIFRVAASDNCQIHQVDSHELCFRNISLLDFVTFNQFIKEHLIPADSLFLLVDSYILLLQLMEQSLDSVIVFVLN